MKGTDTALYVLYAASVVGSLVVAGVIQHSMDGVDAGFDRSYMTKVIWITTTFPLPGLLSPYLLYVSYGIPELSTLWLTVLVEGVLAALALTCAVVRAYQDETSAKRLGVSMIIVTVGFVCWLIVAQCLFAMIADAEYLNCYLAIKGCGLGPSGEISTECVPTPGYSILFSPVLGISSIKAIQQYPDFHDKCMRSGLGYHADGFYVAFVWLGFWVALVILGLVYGLVRCVTRESNVQRTRYRLLSQDWFDD